MLGNIAGNGRAEPGRDRKRGESQIEIRGLSLPIFKEIIMTYTVTATVELEVEVIDGEVAEILYLNHTDNDNEVKEALAEKMIGMRDAADDMKYDEWRNG